MSRAAGVAASGLVLILFALLFNAAPLFVPGLALTFMGVGTPAWIWIAARGARVERQLHSDRAICLSHSHDSSPVCHFGREVAGLERGALGSAGSIWDDTISPDLAKYVRSYLRR